MAKMHEIWLGIKAKLDNAVPKAFQDVTKLSNQTKAAVEKFSKINPFAKLNPDNFIKKHSEVKAKLENTTGAFNKTQSKTAQLRNEYEKAQQVCKKLANEIKGSSASTAKQELAFKRAIQQSDQLKISWRQGINESKQLRKELQEQQNQLKELNSQYAFKSLQKKLTTRAEQNKQNGTTHFANATNALYTAKAATQSVSFLTEPIKQAMKFESVMADIRKLVHFDTPQEFAEMGEQLKQLSLRVPMAVDGLAHIAASAAQAGIAKEDILQFTENAAQMGVAYNITAEQAGDMMAKWRSAFSMNQDQVMQLADQINILSDNSAATGVEIGDVVTRIGSLGKIAGVSQAQLSALAATSIGGGFKADVAATGIKKLFTVLTSGESVTRGQAEEFDKLGINVVQLSKDIQAKGAPAILDILKKIKGLDQYKQVSTIKAIFGEEAIGPIAALASNIGTVEQHLTLVGNESKYAGSMLREFNARSATTENTMQLFKNSIAAISITIGNTFLPSLNQMMTDINKTLNESIMPFINAHKDSIKILGEVALGIAGTVAAIAGGKAIYSGFASIFSAASGAVSICTKMLLWFIPQQWRAVAATKAMEYWQKLCNLAMKANPYVRIATLLIALGVAIYEVCTHWEEFTDWVSTVYDKIKSLFGWLIKVKDAVASLFDGNDGKELNINVKNTSTFAEDMAKVNQNHQANANNDNSVKTYNAKPVINVYGNGDPASIEKAVGDGMQAAQVALFDPSRNNYGYS